VRAESCKPVFLLGLPWSARWPLELTEDDDNGCVGMDHFVAEKSTRLFWKEEGLPWELVQRTHESEDHDSEVPGWSKSEKLTQDWFFATCFGTLVRRLEKESGSS